MKRHLSLILLFVTILILTGCGASTKNTPPELVKAVPATLPNSSIDITENETIQLSVEMIDVDGDELTYEWSASAGTIQQTADPTVAEWTAPATQGMQTVTVIGSDGKDPLQFKWTFDVGNTTTGTIEINDHIFDDATWRTGNIYVITQSIDVDGTLTIEPGTIIKFTKGNMLTVNGQIIANGTVDAPIVFTSYLHDLGGDTNQDGNASQPQPKDWMYLSLENVEGASLSYCEFYYGGQEDQFANGTLFLNRTYGTIDNCTFAYNGNGIDASSASADTVITNSTFYENQVPMIINSKFSIDDSNRFHNPENENQLNHFNQILIKTNTIQHDINWSELEVPFVISGELSIMSTGSLTLATDLVLKFKQGSSLSYSGSNLLGREEVTFTSYRDDFNGGDTNGDGNATTPAYRDWVGIRNLNTGNYETWSNIFYDTYAYPVTVAQL